MRRCTTSRTAAEGLKLAGAGVIVGVAVALPLTRLLRAFLFGVTATDAV